MKRITAIILLTIVACLHAMTLKAALGDWKIYMSYHDIQQIEETGNILFVRASNSLYMYNKNDGSIHTFDKTHGLNDVYIELIGWNSHAKQLVAVYDNSNIDLIDMNGNVYNINELYQKDMTDDKKVNSITMSDRYAYLATNFGAVKIDLSRKEISESYILKKEIARIGLDNTYIYAKAKDNSVYQALLTDNLIDKNNWKITTNYPSNIFNVDMSAYDNNIELVKTLNPGGPINNNLGYLKLYDGTLFACEGLVGTSVPAYVQTLTKDDWYIYSNEGITDVTGVSFQNAVCLDVNKSGGKTRVIVGARNGIYEYIDGEFTNFWHNTNSLIEPYNGKSKEYQLMLGVQLDKEGNLYAVNSQAPTKSLLKMDLAGNWYDLAKKELIANDGKSLQYMMNMMTDSRGYIWFINTHWENQGVFCYDLVNDKIVHAITDMVNQDGVSITSVLHSVSEDRNHNIWVGTNSGCFVIEESQIGNSNPQIIQVKVPRNDGTNLADYLMQDVNVNCITIDGGNRKWFGTSGNGIIVVSNDNFEQVYHFTKENSKLLSNIVLNICIDDNTGEVFIATDKGLCSYMSDTTSPSETMEKNQVYAYPNPVTPEYTGLITVVGLSFNADVKILSTNGKVIAEGKSSGGSFTWDGKDKNGERVASGVYMVATAAADGSKGTVCKIVVVR